jgi:hypothetical protein
MKRIHQTVMVLLSVAWGTPLMAQTVNDFFKALGKEVEKQAEQEVQRTVNRIEDECRSQESVAQVDRIDESRRPTYVVGTSDGRLFQLTAIELSGRIDNSNFSLSDLLGAAKRASFSKVSMDSGVSRYRLGLSYQNLGENSSGTIAGLLASAAGATLQDRLPENVMASISPAVRGQSLSATPWCLSLLSSDLSFFRYLQEE